MNAYEFTKFEADYTSKIKAAKYYDANVLAWQVKSSLGDWEKDADYIEATDAFIDVTMSCNAEERINWLEYFMSNAIAYGIQTKNRDWRGKYLAAYNLLKGVRQSVKQGSVV